MEADIIQDLGLQLTSRSISSLRTEVTQEKNKEKKTVSRLITKRGHNMTLGGSTLLSREGRQPLPKAAKALDNRFHLMHYCLFDHE